MAENPSTNRVFYSYNPEVNLGVIDPELLSTYSDSLILDLKNRNIWFQGVQFGNSYWGSSYGETFNDFARNSAYGEFSQATGTGTNAYGFASQANGISTVASNSGEVAFGQYNESVKTVYDVEHGGSVFTIGDGKSDSNRHNIVDVRKDGSLIKNGASYFNDYVYAPIAYSYVDHIGHDVTMDQIVRALLDEVKYDRPLIYWKYLDAENGTQWIDIGWYEPDFLYIPIRSTIEVGSHIHTGVSVRWDYDQYNGRQNLSYVFMDPSELPSHDQSWIGLSYGFVDNGIHYQLIDPDTLTLSEVRSCDESDLPIVNSSTCAFDKHGTYTLARLDSVDYRECSYKYYPQLFNIGVYKVSNGAGDYAWYPGGTATFGDNEQITDVKYKYWYGLSDVLPSNRDLLDAFGQSGWLEFPEKGKSIEQTFTVGNGYNKKIMWMAYPKNLYAMVPWSDTYKIKLRQPDGIEFDLMSGWQTMKRMSVTVECGNSKLPVEYWVAYCEFESQLGNPYAEISFRIAAADLPDLIYIMNEDNEHMRAGEDGSSYLITENVDNVDDNDIWVRRNS